jgi:hypothetical protein
LSGNICPLDDWAEAAVVGIAVPSIDMADHAGLLDVAEVVGAVHGKVVQRGELSP